MKLNSLDAGAVRRFLLAMSIGAYALALVRLFGNREPSPSGRRGAFFSFLYRTFGEYALVCWWVLVGTFLLVLFFRKK